MRNTNSQALSMDERDTDGQPTARTDWQPPELDTSELQQRFGDSVLLEFIRGHSFSDILRELVQNEYDAGGNVLQVAFGDTGLEITGNGAPIDGKGWKRLSVTLGTGSVPGMKGALEQKVNGIGSKNFGLRSLFLFGNRIYIRSNGKETVLDLQHGTLKRPRIDATTVGMRGVRIHVPYRTNSIEGLNAFTFDKESNILDDFAAQISLSLLKLAQHDKKKSLKRVIVTSARNGRRIIWNQNVKKLTTENRKMSLFRRRITMTDSRVGKAQTLEEFEWQKRFSLPEGFRKQHIPSYFRDHGSRIRIGISLQTKREKIHPNMSKGIAYYPIGVAHAYTGNSVSVNAPFEMDADRSELVDPSNSQFNAWLLQLAADMTIELLHTDWFYRFGANVYRAVGAIDRSSLSSYSEAVETSLRKDGCWPSRKESRGRKRVVQFTSIEDLTLVPHPSLDQFLEDNDYLHSDLQNASDLYQLAKQYGAKEFTINSLIRLRCAGKETDTLQSTCKEGEACYYYTEFPDAWKNLSKQKQCAVALDEHRRNLSDENQQDLAVSETTVSASGSLAAAEALWVVPNEIQDVCPVPAENRLHSDVSQNRVLRRLCKRFDEADWIKDVIEKIEIGEASEQERMSLYRYLLSVNGGVPRKLLKAVRNSPVLRDQNGDWVSPKSITALGTSGIRKYRPALHLPHREYAKDRKLARSLRFKNKIAGDDLVRFAEIVAARPAMARDFEKILERSRILLTPRTIKRLASIQFIISNEGNLQSPSSLYLDTPKNRACIGPSGPYPVGNAKKLYVTLGCRSSPNEERILEYLATLRQNEQPPSRPEVLYPELVAALRRESSPDMYKDEEILWSGNGYSTPASSILGGSWNRVFLGNVPLINTTSTKLRRSYEELGVHVRPEQQHWEQFFMSMGERYREERSPLSGGQKSAMHTAYSYCDDNPSLPPDLPWMLDGAGHLRTTSDAETGHFVIEDDVPLGNEIRRLGMAVSFADNTKSKFTSFLQRQGVKYLTEIRKKLRDRVGELRSAPKWFQEEEYVSRLARPDFRSALEAVATRDFPRNDDVIERIQQISNRLTNIEKIVFVKQIFSDYRVGKASVAVSTRYAWTDKNIHLIWVRSRSGLEGMLASLIAGECLPDGLGDHARFSDSVFRLITCERTRDIQEYLEQRGIRWHPKTDDPDGDPEDYVSDVEEAFRAAIRTRPTSSATGGILSAHGVERTGSTVVQNPDATAPLILPPIERVTARIVQPSGNWSYSPGSSGGSGGSGGGWSPGNRNEERDRLIGRRGEEIVFMLEKERVREAGYREDRVRWVSEANPASDFDIESVDDDGEKLFIEVKATTGPDGKFYWSMPEFQRALQKKNRYILYRVYLVSDPSPIVCPFRNPVALISSGSLHLDIASFRAEVQPRS